MTTDKKHVAVYLEPDQQKLLKRIAAADGRSMSNLGGHVLGKWLETEGRKLLANN